MKLFGRAVCLGASLALLLAPVPEWTGAEAAEYRFDDLYGPSGVGAQWMVITGGSDTLGASASSVPIDVSGDIVSDQNPVELMSGTYSGTTPSNRDVGTMFLVMPDAQGSFTADFSSPAYEAVTPDNLVDLEAYSAQKDPQGIPSVTSDRTYYTSSWRQYDFTLVKNKDQGVYESVRGNFIFHQNPYASSSQTLEVPFIVANVHNTTAELEPLLFRATLRDERSATRGNIVAYDHFTWDVVSAHTAGGNQWVLVPVSSWPIYDTAVYYGLATDVTNHSAVRYAVQRYDSYSWQASSPIHWRFDLPRTTDLGDVPKTFLLDPLSHIAPGLSTVYYQRYNVNEGQKVPLRLYSVDPASGFRELTLNHRVIFGLDLGLAEGTSGTRSPAPYIVQAFNPRSSSTSFLENVAKAMSSSGSVLVPTSSLFSQSSTNEDYVSGGVIASFAVSHAIPSSLRSGSSEGMLPLHVTFNLPKTNLQVSPHWNEMLLQWRQTGDVHDLFAKYFSVFLMSRKTGQKDNPWNLVQELESRGVFSDQIKVFVDEEREVLTVSFIVMLMDGTRDGVRPALTLVEDTSVSASNTFMIVRDGWADQTWGMTFFVAPAGYTDNSDNTTSGNISSSSGGGGCSAGLGAGALLAVAVLLRRRAKDEK